MLRTTHLATVSEYTSTLNNNSVAIAKKADHTA